MKINSDKFHSFLILMVLSLFSNILLAQESNYQSGAKSKAFSDASVAFTDHWAIFNNPAGLAYVESFSIGFYAENRFNIGELNGGSIGIVKPIGNKNTFGISFYTFNNSSYYARQKFGLAYSKGLGNSLSFGLQFNLLRTYIENYGFNLSFCGEAGLIYKISEKTTFGAFIFNPTATKYSKYEEERIPTVMRVGLTYKIADPTTIAIEVENSTDNDFALKGGFGYDLTDAFSLQIGVRSKPFANSFGIAFKTKKIGIHISMIYMQVLDSTPSISFDYMAAQ